MPRQHPPGDLVRRLPLEDFDQLTRPGGDGHREVLGVVETLPLSFGSEGPQSLGEIADVHSGSVSRRQRRPAAGPTLDAGLLCERTQPSSMGTRLTPMENLEADMEKSKINKVLCKGCGAEGLGWVRTGTGWRLFKGSELHVCPDIESMPTVQNPSVAEFARRARERGSTRHEP
jgi:hypothetical protein